MREAILASFLPLALCPSCSAQIVLGLGVLCLAFILRPDGDLHSVDCLSIGA
jgi:hypothetical protein